MKGGMADAPILAEVSGAILALPKAPLHYHVYILIMKIWDKEKTPSDLRDALNVWEPQWHFTPVYHWEDWYRHSLGETSPPIRGDPP